MTNKNLRLIVKLSLVAALYVALTLVLYPLSYGAIQFRLSEALMMLVAYNPIYSISLIIGCLISNIASPMGVTDVIFGTLATVVSCIMFKVKNKTLSSLIPAIANAIIIGLELQFVYEVPFYLGSIQVFIGEFVVVTLIGVPVFKSFEQNEKMVELLDLKNIYENKFSFKPYKLLTLGLSIIGLVMYFYLGFVNIEDTLNSTYDVYSLSKYTFETINNQFNRYLILLLLLPIFKVLVSFLLNKKKSSIINIVISSIEIIVLICGIVLIKQKETNPIDPSFYMYFVYYIIYICINILFISTYKKEDSNVSESNVYDI